MNASQFARERGKIERALPEGAKRRNALRRLVNQAKAVPIIIRGNPAGWRMPTGEMVCMKRRFPDLARAEREIQSIGHTNWDQHRAPSRAYECRSCLGFHLTSQRARFAEAA